MEPQTKVTQRQDTHNQQLGNNITTNYSTPEAKSAEKSDSESNMSRESVTTRKTSGTGTGWEPRPEEWQNQLTRTHNATYVTTACIDSRPEPANAQKAA